MKLIRTTIIFFLISFIGLSAFTQAKYFFRDSENSGYYDSGLAFKSGQSTIKQAGPSGDKIPVELGQKVFQGDHSLEITWNSKAGGDWLALIIAPGFPLQDLSQTDTLSFWVYSDSGITKSLLPKIYLEGAPNNTKSNKYELSLFSDDISQASWTEIKVPMDTFFNDPNQTNINFSMIKAVILGQNQADGQPHTLFVDEVKAYNSATSSLPVATPLSLQATGYDSHVRLTWSPNSEPHLGGYYIYQSADNGNSYQLRKFLTEKDSVFNDFTGFQGKDLDLKYQISAVNIAGNPSTPSNSIDVSTYEMTDEELMTMVQEATFRYFWDYAEPNSGMARERNNSGNTVTSGGSGFGIMAILVGIERGFISRNEGIERILKILNFLKTADRFHGAWSHWIDGVTGDALPFSQFDDGGDLVETAFLVQGMLTAKSYFDQSNPEEDSLRAEVTQLWEGVEWNWYRKLTNNVLYWHWSPNHSWQINFPLRGFNEVHITYLLGIASPTHAIPASLYHTGWAGNSNYTNGTSTYGHPIILGSDYGGPLFFAHYSYLGFDPRGIKDDYANYYTRNQNHSLINWKYCIENPKGFAGYDSTSWGLTASDDPLVGYLAHEPNSNRDNGTISPTAALSSMPYTPEPSMDALRYFYRELGDKLWGEMGFYDAFNLSENWFARSYLAIDQGPIMLMIENHRSGLLWEKFMQNPEIQPALDTIGFVEDNMSIEQSFNSTLKIKLGPNPTKDQAFLSIDLSESKFLTINLINSVGETIAIIQESKNLNSGEYHFSIPTKTFSSGLYFLKIESPDESIVKKLIVL